MLICHCPAKHTGKHKSAICVSGHYIRICVEPGCLSAATACPMPECKQPIALWHKHVDQPSPYRTPGESKPVIGSLPPALWRPEVEGGCPAFESGYFPTWCLIGNCDDGSTFGIMPDDDAWISMNRD
jgi:hypothetical protein